MTIGEQNAKHIRSKKAWGKICSSPIGAVETTGEWASTGTFSFQFDQAFPIQWMPYEKKDYYVYPASPSSGLQPYPNSEKWKAIAKMLLDEEKAIYEMSDH